MPTIDDKTPVLDQEVIEQLRTIDPEGKGGLLKRLIEIYLESAATVVTEIQQDFKKSDTTHLRHLVHRFRTSNANLGLKRMHQILTHLEIDELSHDDQRDLVEKLGFEVQKAVTALRSIE